jgi:uncharacterized protein involved in exopolysaccharide biosynthesis
MKHLEETSILSTPQTQKLNLQTLMLLLQQNKRMFVTIFLFVWLLTSVYTVVGYKPSYVSSGMVMIKDTALTAKYVTADNYEMTAAQSTSSVMNTMGLLKTTIFMDDLWKFFNAKHPEALAKLKIKDFKDWQEFFGNGSKLIKYSNMPGTDLISMEFKWEDPQIAKEGLEVIMQTFRESSLQINRTEQHERSRYLAQQINDIQNKLVLVQAQSSQFKSQNGVVNSAEENINLTKAKMDIKTSLAVTNAEAAGKASQVSGYKKLLGMNTHDALRATGLGRNETLAKLQADLYVAQSERASLLTKYTEQSVKVQEVNNHISELQASIQKETNRSVGRGGQAGGQAISDETRGHAVGDMVSATTEAQQLSSKNRVLGGYLHELEARAKDLPRIEAKLSNYEMEESALNSSLKTLKEKELDAKLKESQSLSNVFVVDKPRIPVDASFPRLPHLLVFDFMLGLACAVVGLWFKRNKTENALQVAEIEKLLGTQFRKDYATVPSMNGTGTNGKAHKSNGHLAERV